MNNWSERDKADWSERLTQVVVRFPGAKLRYDTARDAYKFIAPDGRRSVVTGQTIEARTIDVVCQQTTEWLGNFPPGASE